MKTYRLLIFDWDGTLMDSRDKIVNCYAGAARDHGIDPPDPEQAAQLIGLSILDSLSKLYPQLSQDVHAGLAKSYGEHWRDKDQTPMALFGGVREGLEDLGRAGYLLSIATGKSAKGLQHALRETNLADRFAYARCGDQGRPKPDPEMLQKILGHTGMSKSEAMMIGDTSFDLEMAARAGMDGWGACYGSHSKEQLQHLSCRPPASSFAEIVAFLC